MLPLHALAIRSCGRAANSVRTICSAKIYPYHKGALYNRLSRSVAFAERRKTHPFNDRRTFLTESVPSIAIPPVVFTGLLFALWTYKCFIMVIFQDKIIYMPYMPPFARSEKLEDYTAQCRPVEWRQERIKSLDGTKISVCIGNLAQHHDLEVAPTPQKKVVLCYYHGNGGSLPPRLPMLSNVLKAIAREAGPLIETRFTIAALSYRGYWNSSGRASQSGMELDAQALLRWINTQSASSQNNVRFILWGQSIGAGVASTAAAIYFSSDPHAKVPLDGLILETPFTSIRSMLVALYPQKWLPYRYLWPFLWNHWDSEAALKRIAQSRRPPKILLLPATRDEVVPSEEADNLERLCKKLKLNFIREDVAGALHTEATTRREGQKSVAKFACRIGLDE